MGYGILGAAVLVGIFLLINHLINLDAKHDEEREDKLRREYFEREDKLRHEKWDRKSIKDAESGFCPYCGHPMILYKDKISACDYCKAEIKL